VAYETSHPLYSVWATTRFVWVVSEGGIVLVHDRAAGSWSLVESGSIDDILAVWGTADDDVWMTGTSSFLGHFDGSKLTAYRLETPGIRLTTVFGVAGAGTWAAGYAPNGDAHCYPYLVEVERLRPRNLRRIPLDNFFVLTGVAFDATDIAVAGYQSG